MKVEKKIKKPVAERTWFIIVMLCIFLPVGLYLMWAKSDWNPNVKKGVSALFAIIIVANVFGGITSTPLEAVKVENATVKVGEDGIVKYTMNPKDADISDVEFNSSNDCITIDYDNDTENIKITGDKPGTVRVNATFEDCKDNKIKSNEFTVKVTGTKAEKRVAKKKKKEQGLFDFSNDNESKSKNYVKVSATDLIAALDKNPLKAERKYNDMDIAVTGRLNNIDSSGNYFSIKSTSDKYAITLASIKCDMDDDSVKDKIADMNIGDEVTVKGTVTDVGEILGYDIDVDSVQKA